MTLEFLGESYKARQEAKEEELENQKAVQSYLELKKIIDSPETYKDYKNSQENEMAESLKEDFKSLVGAIRNYIDSANRQEHYFMRYGTEVTEEAKAEQESVDGDRKATHNILMRELNIVAFKLDKLGIDNNLISAIINSDRKLDLENQLDRRAVEKWTREVGDYLATTSETTL